QDLSGGSAAQSAVPANGQRGEYGGQHQRPQRSQQHRVPRHPGVGEAARVADSGFHSATAPSQPGIWWGATNTFDTAESGNASGNTMIGTASGFGTTSPRKMPIQVSANRNHKIN